MRTARVVVIAAAASCGGVALALPPEKDVWRALDTPGFSILGDAPADRLVDVARDMESLRLVLARIGGRSAGEVRPIPVVVFSNVTAFDPYRKGLGGKTDNIAGFFATRAGRRMIALMTYGGRDGYTTVYHEYLHHVVRTRLGKVPVWFDEGIAGLYESFVCEGEAAVVGRPPRDKLYWLNHKPWIPLEEIFHIADGGKLHDQDDERTTAFYAQSWLLVHDLFFGHPERREQLAAFLAAYAAGRPHDEAFEASFQGGIAGVDAEVKAYLHGNLPYVTLTFGDLKVAPVGEVRIVDRGKVLDTLGELLLVGSRADTAGAEEHFRAALALAPGDLRAKAGLGEAAYVAGRKEDAAVQLDAAVDAGLDDPVALTLAARLAADRSDARAAPNDEAVPPSVARARALSERALAAEPDDPDVLSLFGSTFVGHKGDPEKGIDALKKADAIEPDRPDVVRDLLWLFVQAKRRVEAEAVAARIVSHGGADAKVDAADALAMLDLMESDDATRAKDYERAIALLKSARARTSREALRPRIDERIKMLEAAAADARRKKPPTPAPKASPKP